MLVLTRQSNNLCVSYRNATAGFVMFQSSAPTHGEEEMKGVSSGDKSAPVGLTMVAGGNLYIQKARWLNGITPTGDLVTKFKQAHAACCKAKGFTESRVTAEQTLFGMPIIWTLEEDTSVTGGMPGPSIIPTFLCNATRLAFTTLSVAEVEALSSVAAALGPIEDFRPESVAPILKGLPPASSATHKQQLSEAMSFLLNLPETCDAFMYCVGADACLCVRASLDLDDDKVASLGQASLQLPTAEEKCESRLVCFWCGVSPLQRGVKLSCCTRCSCVAYCGALCQRLDWEAEHHRECKRTEQGVHLNAMDRGIVSLPCTELAITRAVTERGKPASMRAQVAAESESLLSIRRLLCLGNDGEPTVIPMLWELK